MFLQRWKTRSSNYSIDPCFVCVIFVVVRMDSLVVIVVTIPPLCSCSFLTLSHYGDAWVSLVMDMGYLEERVGVGFNCLEYLIPPLAQRIEISLVTREVPEGSYDRMLCLAK